MATKAYPFAKPRKAFMGVLMTCVLSLALAAPAHAESVSATCNAGFVGQKMGTVEATAFYTVDGTFHTWYQFQGRITKTTNLPGGNSNNINFAFYQDGNKIWSKNSPDNLQSGQLYTAAANIRVPELSGEQARTEGILDLSGLPDPHCYAWSSGV